MLIDNHTLQSNKGKMSGHVQLEHIFGFYKTFKKIKGLGFHPTFKTSD